MSSTQRKKAREKVYAYIVHPFCDLDHLLVFRHLDFPEAGIQVPGGTVEPGEAVQAAAVREAVEETGLNDLDLVRKLGFLRSDMQIYGLNEIPNRHFYQFTLRNDPQGTWVAYENTPSDGSVGPIALEFFWVPLASVPTLSGGLGAMLDALRRALNP